MLVPCLRAQFSGFLRLLGVRMLVATVQKVRLVALRECAFERYFHALIGAYMHLYLHKLAWDSHGAGYS